MNDVPLYYKDIIFNYSFENSKGVNVIKKMDSKKLLKEK